MGHPGGTWAEAIEALTPHEDHVAWLLVRWNPIAERWFVYQVLPPFATPLMVCADDQPLMRHPQHGFWIADGRRGGIKLDRDMVDSISWQIYQETGRYSRSYWIVQGDKGGHKRRFTPIEQRLATLHQKPRDPPAPGALPFAPVDRRVYEKLAPYDQLLTWEYAFRLDERTPEFFEAREHEALRDVREQYWQWMESQVDSAFDSTGTRQRPLDIPTSDRAPEFDYEMLKETLLTMRE